MSFFGRRGHAEENVDGLGKSPQMGVTFTSISERAIVQQSIADDAEINDESKGKRAADILRKSAIPIDDGDDAWVYESCLYDAARKAPIDCYPEKVGIGSALETAYSQLAAGVDSRPKHAYGLPYVKLGAELARENGLVLHKRRASGADPRVKLARYYDAVNSIIAEEGRDVPMQVEILLESDNEPPVYPAFALVLNNWDILKEHQVTYQYLVYLMASIDNWQDTAAERMRLRDVCIEVSKDVQADKLRREAEREKARREAVMVDIPMADGAVATVPRAWIKLTPPEPEACSYAGAIEVKNAGVADVPHFVFFVRSHPVYEMTAEERAAVIRAAVAEYPALSEIQKREVSLEYSSDGGIANYQEYINAPVIGLFPLMESTSVTEYNQPPYGAVIKRADKEANTE